MIDQFSAALKQENVALVQYDSHGLPKQVYTCFHDRCFLGIYERYSIDFCKSGGGWFSLDGSGLFPIVPLSGLGTFDEFVKRYNLIGGNVVYCLLCDDNVLEDGDYPCEHLMWSYRLKTYLLYFHSIPEFIHVWREHGGWERGGF